MRLQPALDDLITAALAGIASHPLVRVPPVYYPGTEERVFIREFRDFGGLNLDGPDDGLSCSVYPYSTARDALRGAVSRFRSVGASATFQSQVLGRRESGASYDAATYTLVVELGYKDSGLGLPREISYHVADFQPLQAANHAYGYSMVEGTLTRMETLVVRTNPAEVVLRRYADYFRLILMDLPTLQPFNVRYTQVLGYDLHTSNWLQHSTNVYFHQCYLIWEIHLYVPNSLF